MLILSRSGGMNYDDNTDYEDYDNYESNQNGGQSDKNENGCIKTPLNSDNPDWETFCGNLSSVSENTPNVDDGTKNGQSENSNYEILKAQGAGSSMGLTFKIDHLPCAWLASEDFIGSKVSMICIIP